MTCVLSEWTTRSLGFTDCELPFGKMWKWILAKSYQRKIFSCGNTSSDRLHGIFLYGISLLRANITSVYAAQKDAKRNYRARARIVVHRRIFRKWILSSNTHIIIHYICMFTTLKYIKIYVNSIIWCGRISDANTFRFINIKCFMHRGTLYSTRIFFSIVRDGGAWQKGKKYVVIRGDINVFGVHDQFRSRALQSSRGTVLGLFWLTALLGTRLSGGPSRAEVRTIVGRYWRPVVTDRLAHVCVYLSQLLAIAKFQLLFVMNIQSVLIIVEHWENSFDVTNFMPNLA